MPAISSQFRSDPKTNPWTVRCLAICHRGIRAQTFVSADVGGDIHNFEEPAISDCATCDQSFAPSSGLCSECFLYVPTGQLADGVCANCR